MIWSSFIARAAYTHARCHGPDATREREPFPSLKRAANKKTAAIYENPPSIVNGGTFLLYGESLTAGFQL